MAKKKTEVRKEVDPDASYEKVMEDLEKIGSPSNIGSTEDCIESPSLKLDYALGGYGVPRGRFSMIAGPESAGKTTTLMLYGIGAIQKGLKVAIINREGKWNIPYARESGMGMPGKDYLLLYPESAESTVETIRMLARYKFDFVGVESIAALAPIVEIQGDIRDQNVGLLSRIMSKFFRDAVLEVAAANTAVFFTNQLRDKIGTLYGDPSTAPGGRAKDYAATVDIRLTSPNREYDPSAKDEKFECIGMTVNGKVKKSVGVNHRKVEYDVRFVPGLHVDRTQEILDFGLRLKMFTLVSGEPKSTKAGGWAFSGQKLGGSEIEAKKYLTENVDTMDEIEIGIRQVMRSGAIIPEIKKHEQSEPE